jgi:alcohol dehydrogenase
MGVDVKPLPISPVELVTKRIKIIGSQQNGREYLYEALALAANGKVRVVAETYGLDEIRKAYERVESGEVRFRAVVTM